MGRKESGVINATNQQSSSVDIKDEHESHRYYESPSLRALSVKSDNPCSKSSITVFKMLSAIPEQIRVIRAIRVRNQAHGNQDTLRYRRIEIPNSKFLIE